jgi:hypothetical protein
MSLLRVRKSCDIIIGVIIPLSVSSGWDDISAFGTTIAWQNLSRSVQMDEMIAGGGILSFQSGPLERIDSKGSPPRAAPFEVVVIEDDAVLSPDV